MKSFDFYEFAGILAPGAIVLLCLAKFYPSVSDGISTSDISVGGFGIFTILSYVAGHLTQAVGNFVESVWWWCRGKIPSDWVRTKPMKLLSEAQVAALPERLAKHLALKSEPDLALLSQREWFSLTRQIYAAVSAEGRAARIDTFNGNYGLHRGIAAALLCVSVALLLDQVYQPALLAFLVAFVALLRMDRFGRHYARELFVQFLQLPSKN